MRYIFLLLCVLCILTGGCENTTTAVLENIVQATLLVSPVVRIENKDGALTSAGTACLVKYANRYYILTAYHTLDKIGTITIYADNRKAIPVILGKPVRLGQTDCSAIPIVSHLLKTDWFEIAPSRLRSDKCMAYGYPRDGDLYNSQGCFVTVKVQTTTDAIIGMSGGPVISGNKLVGIISSMCINEDGTKTAFATGVDIIAYYLERL